MKGCRPLTLDEVRRASRAFGGYHAVRNHCLFVLGVNAGFRISEMLSLRIRDVVRGRLVVREVAVPRRAMKGKREGRTVYLAPVARQAIWRQIDALHAAGSWHVDTFLFRSRNARNRPIRRETAWRILQEAFGSVGIVGKVGCHALRKTFANMVYEFMLARVVSGEPVDPFYEVVKALGHADPKSTTAYLAFRNERVRAAVLHIGEVLHGDHAHG